jgi:ornithine cyclodeaminase/alanine dehydrogenase-like protein (mu-crystallin family)
MKPPPFIDRDQVRAALGPRAAADALEAALRAGLDPESQPSREVLDVGSGHLLVMPAATGRSVTVKLATVGGTPRIQGIAVVFDADRLEPVMLIDGVALTELRTVAVTLAALRRMVRGPVGHLVVFGRGPQGVAHAAALGEEMAPATVTVLDSSSTAAEVAAAVECADLVCCATTAREPLFAGDLVADAAVVVAVGSHEPTARELDATLVRRSAVVVEARRSALDEAGDLIMAGLDAARLTTLAELVAGAPLPDRGPRVFKSTGMAWEDAVVADALLASREAARG